MSFPSKIAIAPLALALFLSCCLACAWLPPMYNQDSFLAAITDKHEALDHARSPKIIFVGGSNLAFGMDSPTVARAFDKDVVNMGLSTMLGLRFQLEEVRDAIEENDLVVVLPEYGTFTYEGFDPTTSYLLNVPLLMPRSMNWLIKSYLAAPKGMKALVKDAYGILNFKCNWWRWHAEDVIATGNANHMFDDCINMGEDRYVNRKGFNKYGDYIGHLHQGRPRDLAMVPTGDRVSLEAINLLNDYYSFVQTRGARMVLLPPPLPKSWYEVNKSTIGRIQDSWKAHLQVPVLGSSARYLYGDDSFFDTSYHLRGAGRMDRTHKVIEDISSYEGALKTASRSETKYR